MKEVSKKEALMSALENWLLNREGLHATVVDAAKHLGVPVTTIIAIAEEHPWMGIDFVLDGPTVFLDGE